MLGIESHPGKRTIVRLHLLALLKASRQSTVSFVQSSFAITYCGCAVLFDWVVFSLSVTELFMYKQ